MDNHAHPNTINPDDKSSDALPLDGLGAIELQARMNILKNDCDFIVEILLR